MKKIKRIIRLLVFIFLIVLAGIGIGISGGVPVPTFKSKRDPNKAKTELVENKRISDSEEDQIKS